ncbi:MAG: hypothetical protein R6X25_15045 [Candidatus Krumholzibacteriia bacterium]
MSFPGRERDSHAAAARAESRAPTRVAATAAAILAILTFLVLVAAATADEPSAAAPVQPAASPPAERPASLAAEQPAASPAAAQPAASPAEQPFTGAGESGAVLPEMVVEAENAVRQKIEKGTFEFPLDAATVDSFLTAMDDLALGVSPVSGLQPHLNNLERLASDQPPHYWIQDMATTPVVTFYPAAHEGHAPQQWSLTITDFRGSPFKTFQGGGAPPREVAWNGRGDQDEMLRVGYPYSYVFAVTDKGTNTYNYAGVSFRIPALDYRRDGDRVLEIAGGQLFVREETALTAAGREWLTRACDEIRRHPYSPVRVVVVAEAEPLAARRADAVATFLADSMILPREQVETGAVQRPDLRAELDGSVSIVIEHVE